MLSKKGLAVVFFGFGFWLAMAEAGAGSPVAPRIDAFQAGSQHFLPLVETALKPHELPFVAPADARLARGDFALEGLAQSLIGSLTTLPPLRANIWEMQLPRRSPSPPEAKTIFTLRDVLFALASVAFVALLGAGILVGRRMRRLASFA